MMHCTIFLLVPGFALSGLAAAAESLRMVNKCGRGE